MQTGTAFFCRRSWRLKIDLRWNFVHIWKSHVCSHMLDVQEANFCFTQFDGIWNYFSWCRSTRGLNSRSWSLGFGNWSVAFSAKPTQQHQIKNRETCRVMPHQTSTPTKPRFQPSTTILIWTMLTLFLQAWSLLNSVRCWIFLKIMERWSWWSSRAEVQQWGMDPEPTDLHLIGCLTESTWTPRFKSNMLTPKTHSLTCWLKEVSRVMIFLSGWHCGSFSLFSRSHFRSVEKATTMSKRIQERKEEEPAVAKPRSLCLFSTSLNKGQSSSFGPDVSNIPVNEQLDSGSVKGAAGNCVRDHVQGNTLKSSRGCGKLQRKIEIQLQTTGLDHHNLQVTDYGYVEKVFTHLRRKLNRAGDDEMFDLKTNVWIWRLFMSTTMISAIHLGWTMIKFWSHARTRTSKGSRRCLIPLWGWCGNFIRNSEFIYYDVWSLSLSVDENDPVPWSSN